MYPNPILYSWESGIKARAESSDTNGIPVASTNARTVSGSAVAPAEEPAMNSGRRADDMTSSAAAIESTEARTDIGLPYSVGAYRS